MSFAAAGGRWYNLYDTPILKKILKVQTYICLTKMMVKLLSSKILHIPQDSIPQKPSSRGQRRYEISCISTNRKSSD